MSRRTATPPSQPSLFDDDPPATPQPPPPPQAPTKSRSRRNHTLELPRPWTAPMPCAATCLTCKRPEGLGLCPDGTCATVCGPPDKRGPVEVCLLTAVLPHRQLGPYAVIHCTHCDGTHWHQPTPGRTYRIGQCGQPYLIHVPHRSDT